MDLKGYLSLTLGKRFDLQDRGAVAAMVVSAILNRGGLIKLVNCPLLEKFKPMDNGEIHALVSNSLSTFDILQQVQAATSNHDAYEALLNAVNWPNEDVSKACLALITDWVHIGLMPATDNGSNTEYQHWAVETLEPAVKVDDGVSHPEHVGWLATGMFPYPVEVNGHSVTRQVLLDDHAVAGDGSLPVEAHMARLLRSTWDAERGMVDPTKLESLAKLLAEVMTSQQEVAAAAIEQTKANEQTRLWPKDESHWLFDDKWATMQAAFPVPMEHPKRLELAQAIEGAAKFAVSRASGMGTSRIFNIEAFVYNVIHGLIGEGNGGIGNLFDFPAFWGCDLSPLTTLRDSGQEIDLPAGGRDARSLGVGRTDKSPRVAVKPGPKKSVVKAPAEKNPRKPSAK